MLINAAAHAPAEMPARPATTYTARLRVDRHAPEYATVEALAEYLIDEERSEALAAEYAAVAVNTGRALDVVKSEVRAYLAK